MGVYVINLDEKQGKGTPWVSLFIDKNMVVYFDSFGIEYILQDLLSKIKGRSITHKKFKIQSDDSIMLEFYWIAFTEYMIAGQVFLDNSNLFLSL